MAKNDFPNIFENISEYKHIRTKIRYPSGDGLLPATVATIKFVTLYLKCSSPNNQTVSKCLFTPSIF